MKLFGVTQREVVGDTLSSLFPPPLSSYPQELLDKCAAQSEADDSNSSSLVVGLHRSGYALPVNAAVNELGGGLSACLFRRAVVPDEFILFMSEDYRITGMSQETMAMTGVGAAAPRCVVCCCVVVCRCIAVLSRDMRGYDACCERRKRCMHAMSGVVRFVARRG